MNNNPCDVKTKLLAEYQRASAAYSKAVSDLARKVGIMSKIEYETLRVATELAAKRTRQARDHLEMHTYEHQC